MVLSKEEARERKKLSARAYSKAKSEAHRYRKKVLKEVSPDLLIQHVNGDIDLFDEEVTKSV